MRRWFFVLIIMIGAGLILSAILLGRRDSDPPQANLVARAAAEDMAGFARAEGPRPLQFPADHGPHPAFQTEWWYYTGNLETPQGRHFGFQLTFFRRALQPPQERGTRASDWSTEQVYMAHFALSNVAGRDFQAFERLQRGAAGLAGAQAAPFQVWLDDWSVSEIEPDVYRLQAAQDGVELDLRLVDTKGPVLQGDRGYSPKGPEPGQASFYYSLTRLAASGTVRTGGASYPVSGASWMDHEFSTSALAEDQIGWDWFALQLDDGSELMAFQIRKTDGSIDPFSSGILIAPDGRTQPLQRDDFRLQVESTWNSPRSGATYPAEWRLEVPSAGLELRIWPYLADQELNVSYAYWEGAVRIEGRRGAKAVSGSGYAELTGYARAMGGEF